MWSVTQHKTKKIFDRFSFPIVLCQKNITAGLDLTRVNVLVESRKIKGKGDNDKMCSMGCGFFFF